MTKDDILQAFRMIAMGRVNTPQQEELAEKLAAVFAAALPVALEGGEVPPVTAGDKRRKKAA